jgi:hypothetical protein
MTKSRELAMLRQLETLAVSPRKHSTRSIVVAVCVVIGGGVFLSVADNLLFPKQLEALKWSYLGCGMLAGAAAFYVASTFQPKSLCQYINLDAVRKRLAELNEAWGADV